MPKVEQMKELIKKIENTEYLIENLQEVIDEPESSSYFRNVKLSNHPTLQARIKKAVIEEKETLEELLAELTSNDFIFPNEPLK